MKMIPLTKGYEAMVDDDDFEWLSQWKWTASVGRDGKRVCAYRQIQTNWKIRTLLMHRIILNAKPGTYVDHEDRNGINNQKHNLRSCTQTQNMGNQGLNKRNKSGFKGVSWSLERKKFCVGICFNKKVRHVGRYSDPKDAARAYDRAAELLYGEFALTNKKLGLL